jgi:hypothetical protein
MFSVLLVSIRLVTQRNAWLPFSMCGPGTRRSSWELSRHRATVHRPQLLHLHAYYLSLSPRSLGRAVPHRYALSACWCLCASPFVAHTRTFTCRHLTYRPTSLILSPALLPESSPSATRSWCE